MHLSAQGGGAQNGLYAPEVVPQRRTARKRTGASAGSDTSTASPVLAASPSAALSAHQQRQTSDVTQGKGRPTVLELPQGAPPAQGPSPSVSGQQQQPAPFDLSAALRGRQSAQASDQSQHPGQAAERRTPQNSYSPAVATRHVPEAQTHATAVQPGASHGVASGQVAGMAEAPGQAPGPLGKRPAEPGSGPSAKRAKRSDGSLLSLANKVIRDFARRRLGGASIGNAGVRHPGIPYIRSVFCFVPLCTQEMLLVTQINQALTTLRYMGVFSASSWQGCSRPQRTRCGSHA